MCVCAAPGANILINNNEGPKPGKLEDWDHAAWLQALEASGGGCRMQLELPLAAAATAAAGSATPG